MTGPDAVVDTRPTAVVTGSARAPASSSANPPDWARRTTQAAAAVVVVLVAALLGFILWKGLALFLHSGVALWEILSPTWQPDPTAGPTTYGLLPFILGTLGVVAVAAVIAAPLSVALALFMAEVAPAWARRVMQPAMEVFVGIPSVVYGWLGLTILVPYLAANGKWAGFTNGFSWFAGSLVLVLMILPTVASVAYDAFRAVPAELRTASLALGSTRWQTIRHVLLPASGAGIATGVVLGMMRAAGEALAVQMVIGNRPLIPTGLTQPLTTLTAQITLDMGNTVAGETWNEALWTMGLVLVLMSFAAVTAVRLLARRAVPR